jgi:lipopolysaccharide export LptBFGC system permease protein LptF
MSNLMNFNSLLGKMIIIILIIVATHFHILAGILILLVIISMKQPLFEGMENNNTNHNMTDHQDKGTSESFKHSANIANIDKNGNKNDDMGMGTDMDTDNDSDINNNSSISMFKKNNCKNGILMKNGKRVTSDLIKESFPNLKFTKEQCNPCDDDCEFEIVSSVEQITNEENLRPHDSNTQPVDRERVTKKQ